jgi:hypothetical protein
MDPFARKMIFGAIAFGSSMLLMAGGLSVVYFHMHPRCSEQVLSESISPDKQWIGAVMERRCGEESPFLIHVNLRPAQQAIRLGYFSGQASEGEIFVTEEVFVAGEALPSAIPKLEWSSADQLNIKCSHCNSAFARAQSERWQSVRIRYSAEP